MERCAYCQGVLDPSGRFCRNCGQMQPAKAASAAPPPAGVTRPLETYCAYCGGEIAPDARACIFCARPVKRSPTLARGSRTRPLALCRFCGEELLQGARFCVTCSRPVTLSDPATEIAPQPVSRATGPHAAITPAALAGAGALTVPPAVAPSNVPGMYYSGPVPAVSPLAAAPQVAPSNVPGMYYSGPVPAVPPMAAAPQVAQASAPAIPAAPQVAGANAPTIPAAPQIGGNVPGAVPQAIAKGAAKGIGGKLLATTQAKVLTIILVTALAVPTGAAVVVAAQGGNPFSFLTHKGSTTPSSGPTATFIPTATATPAPQTLVAYRGHSRQINFVAWSPDGTRIASGSDDHTVQIWNATTGLVLRTLENLPDDMNSIAWSPDSSRIATASDQVDIWDANTGTHLLTYQGHTVLGNPEPNDDVNSIAWSNDGTRLVSGGDDDSVQVWDANSGATLWARTLNSNVSYVSWSPNSSHVAALEGRTNNTGENRMYLFDASGNLQYVSSDHSKALWGLTWSPDGQRVAISGSNALVEILNANTGAVIFTYQGHQVSVYTLAWSPNGQWIASGSRDDTVRVWDVTDGSLYALYRQHSAPVYSIAWQPLILGGTRLVSGDSNGNIYVWTPRQGG